MRTCDDCMSVLNDEDTTNAYGIFQACKCADLNNNLLMWSVLTYGAGFINWWIYKNECGYCQSHANIQLSNKDYQNHIVDMQTIEMIVKANPHVIVEVNTNGDTIFTIIDDVILYIADTIKTYENPSSDYTNEISIGKKHISELKKLYKWLEENSPLSD
jgi:hypothetical protein